MAKGHDANRILPKSKPTPARRALMYPACDAASQPRDPRPAHARHASTPSPCDAIAASPMPTLCRRSFPIFAAVFAIPPKLSFRRDACRLWPKTVCEAQPYAPAILRAVLRCVPGCYTRLTGVHVLQVPCRVRPGAGRRIPGAPILRIKRPPVPPWFRSFYRGGERRPSPARRRHLSLAARRAARPGARQAAGNNFTCAEEVWKFRREDRGPRRLPNAR
jgi:hypothetical protein